MGFATLHDEIVERSTVEETAPMVFVSHSHFDNDVTHRIVTDMIAAGADVWVDVVDVTRGDFLDLVNEALASREWVVAILSRAALQSRWVRLEVNAAFGRVIRGQMKGLLPILVEQLDIRELPPMWATLHVYDATKGYNEALAGLLHAMNAGFLEASPPLIQEPQDSLPSVDTAIDRIINLGFRPVRSSDSNFVVPPMQQVPAGSFIMGTDPQVDRIGDDDETPQHALELSTFAIGIFPVTVYEYSFFVADGGTPPTPSPGLGIEWSRQLTRPDHPVVCIDYQRALDYVDWLATLTGEPWRLPSEAQWEKAARWNAVEARSSVYPWGDRFVREFANTSVSARADTVPVGINLRGGSPYGVHDMAGNVWDWTISLPGPYPYRADDGRENRYNTGRSRVVRGGSWSVSPRNARSAFREIVDPAFDHPAMGFRLLLAHPSK